MKCSNCNKEMTFFKEGQCCGWKCPECGDSVVTTYYSELEMDNNGYSISVSGNNDSNMVKIKVVSEILNCNYLQAKAKLSIGFTVSNVSAVDVSKIIKSLKNAGIYFSISPEFPYEV